jgi:hypothetical protein
MKTWIQSPRDGWNVPQLFEYHGFGWNKYMIMIIWLYVMIIWIYIIKCPTEPPWTSPCFSFSIDPKATEPRSVVLGQTATAGTIINGGTSRFSADSPASINPGFLRKNVTDFWREIPVKKKKTEWTDPTGHHFLKMGCFFLPRFPADVFHDFSLYPIHDFPYHVWGPQTL